MLKSIRTIRCGAKQRRSSAISNEPETDAATSSHTAGFAPGGPWSTIHVRWFVASTKHE